MTTQKMFIVNQRPTGAIYPNGVDAEWVDYENGKPLPAQPVANAADWVPFQLANETQLDRATDNTVARLLRELRAVNDGLIGPISALQLAALREKVTLMIAELEARAAMARNPQPLPDSVRGPGVESTTVGRSNVAANDSEWEEWRPLFPSSPK
jgi:hypothetical protein